MQANSINRRRFLTLVAQGALATAVLAAIGQVARFLAFEPPGTSSTVFPVGQPDAYGPGVLVYVPEARVYIGRDRAGLYALDAVCPHLGCLVEHQDGGGFACPCHASRFDAEGRAVTGPAEQPLHALRLWFDQEQGQLYLDRARQVEPAARLGL